MVTVVDGRSFLKDWREAEDPKDRGMALSADDERTVLAALGAPVDAHLRPQLEGSLDVDGAVVGIADDAGGADGEGPPVAQQHEPTIVAFTGQAWPWS